MRIILKALLIFLLSSAVFLCISYSFLVSMILESMIFGLIATVIYLAVVGLRARSNSTMRIILKVLIMGFLGYLFASLFFEQHLVPVIFGLLVAAIYFTAIKLRAINEEYAARVNNGIKWMRISFLLGPLPYVIFIFLYFFFYYYARGIDFFGYSPLYYLEIVIDKYPFILGPLAGLYYVMGMLFPESELNVFIATSLWLFVPLVVGFFIYKKRRHSYENANISAKS